MAYLLAWAWLALVAVGADAALKEAFQWRQIDFAWPSPSARQRAIATGAFKPESNVPVGIEVYEDRVFVTVPRWGTGIPASLATFKKTAPSFEPALTPYPDWESHNLTAPGWETLNTRIVSPFRMRADRCGRLWVLDTGKADILGKGEKLAQSALLVFDLRDDKLLRRYEIPQDQLTDSSFLVNVAVDVSPNNCEETYAYLADMGSYALIVYSWGKQRSWRVTHNFFLSHPMQGDFSVHGAQFQWVDGIFGLALSKASRYGHRLLYFHAFSSTSEFQVSTEILQNETRATNSYREFHPVGDRGENTQSCASFMDEESGIVFYTQVNTDSITCWNSRTRPHYQKSTIGVVARDNQTLIFPNDVKVDADRNLWVLSDRLALFIYDTLNPEDVNFRIFKATVGEAVNGTICDPNYSGPEPTLDDHPLENRFGNNVPVCRPADGGAANLAATLLTLAIAAVAPILAA